MKSFFTILVFAFIASISFSQNIGIETTDPKSKLHLGEGDIFLQNSSQGIILKSPDGNCWKLGVDNSGTAVFSNISCPDWQCGDILTYQGEDYSTVLIGSQCWMAENLNVGTFINSTVNQTNNGTIEKYCYNNDNANCLIYGGLYKWNEMMKYTNIESSQGICPSGWHIPSDYELKTLEIFLGMTPSEADMTGPRGTNQGSQLAGNEVLWVDGALDLDAMFDSSGFKGLPSGFNASQSFFGLNNDAHFWSSTELNSTAWVRHLDWWNSGVRRFNEDKLGGYSVRCIKN